MKLEVTWSWTERTYTTLLLFHSALYLKMLSRIKPVRAGPLPGPSGDFPGGLANRLAGRLRPGFKMTNETSQSNQRLQLGNRPSAFNLMKWSHVTRTTTPTGALSLWVVKWRRTIKVFFFMKPLSSIWNGAVPTTKGHSYMTCWEDQHWILC